MLEHLQCRLFERHVNLIESLMPPSNCDGLIKRLIIHDSKKCLSFINYL
jgi:hypothetical protein